MEIESKIWKKDSNALFDYESNDYNISKKVITESGYLHRTDKNHLYLEHEEDYSSKTTYMATIKKAKGNFLLK